MKLLESEPGKKYFIINTSGIGIKLMYKLFALGINDIFKVVENSGGPILLEIKGTKIALGRGMAEKIEVKLYEEESNTKK